MRPTFSFAFETTKLSPLNHFTLFPLFRVWHGGCSLKGEERSNSKEETMPTILTPERPKAPSPVHPLLVLEEGSVASLFQPVVSVKKMSVVGLETFGKAFDRLNGRFLEPKDFFRGMNLEEAGLKLALDRLFRQKGLEGFSNLQSSMPNPLLFLNINPSVLGEDVVGSGYLAGQVEGLKLDPQQIVLQVSMAGEWSLPAVEKFIHLQRRNHFLIALKDVNTSYRRLESAFRLHPDILKLEDGMVAGLSRSPARQDAFLYIAKKAHSLGIPVMAGGVESEEDALKALEYGADLLQGGYFSRNYDGNLVLTLGRKARMMFLASRYHRHLTGRARRDRDLKRRCEAAGAAFFGLLQEKPSLIGRDQPSLFARYPALECLYLLDSRGLQASDTLCNSVHIPDRKRFLYKPAPAGSDHSFRDYYFALATGKDHFLTEPYLSMNSGNLCLTYACMWGDPATEDFHILCTDWNAAHI